MEIQFDNLNEESKNVGLEMHKGKTKYMTNLSTEDSIRIEDQDIVKVKEYKYLGQPLKLEDCTKGEVMRRITSGWCCFGRHKEILCNRYIPISLRRSL